MFLTETVYYARDSVNGKAKTPLRHPSSEPPGRHFLADGRVKAIDPRPLGRA